MQQKSESTIVPKWWIRRGIQDGINRGNLGGIRRDWIYLLMISILVLISRLIFLEHSPLSWDASSFYLAADDFNIAEDRPHLPGYFLHVQLIRVFRQFMSPFAANVAPSLLWSVIGCAFFYLLLRRWLEEFQALLLTLFIALNPMLWFYGCVSEIYAFDFAFSVCLVYAGLTNRHLQFTPLILALAAGVRQSSAVLLVPLYLWLWYDAIKSNRISWRSATMWQIIGLAALASWIIPFLSSCGGLSEYLRLYQSHPPGAFADKLSNIISIAQYGLYALTGSALLYLLLKWQGGNTSASEEKRTFPAWRMLLLWIIPSLLMFVLTTYTKGYMLIFIAALPLLMIRRISQRSNAAIITVIALQSLIFLVVPYHLPDAEIWMAPRLGASKWSKAVERVFTVFSMTRSHIQHVNDDHLVVDSWLADPRCQSIVFVDPTFPLTARVLQSRHPERSFAMIYTLEDSTLLVHRGIRQWTQSNVASYLDSACMLTTKQMVEQSELLRPIDHNDELYLCRVQSPNADSLWRWYSAHFVRR